MLVVNRIPSVLRETGADETLLGPALEKITFELLRGREANVSENEVIFNNDEDIKPLAITKIPEISDLQATSPRWEGFLDQVRNSGFLKRLSSDLEEWLEGVIDFETHAPNNLTNNKPIGLSDRERRSGLLRNFAGKMVAAEIAAVPIETPLITGPLRALAEQFTSQLPIVIAEGSNGLAPEKWRVPCEQ